MSNNILTLSEKGDLEALKKALAENPPTPENTYCITAQQTPLLHDIIQTTPLLAAVVAGHQEVTAYLLSHENPQRAAVLASINFQHPVFKYDVLMAAANGGYIDTLKLLLAQAEIKYQFGAEGTTPLIKAVSQGRRRVLAYLLSQENPRQREVLDTIDAVSRDYCNRGTALARSLLDHEGLAEDVTLALLDAGASPDTVADVANRLLPRQLALLLMYGATFIAADQITHLLYSLNRLLPSILPDNSFNFERARRCLAFFASINFISPMPGVSLNQKLTDQLWVLKQDRKFEQEVSELENFATNLLARMQAYLRKSGKDKIEFTVMNELAALRINNRLQRELNFILSDQLAQFIARRERVVSGTSKSGGENYKKRLHDFAILLASIENHYFAAKPIAEKAHLIRNEINMHRTVYHYRTLSTMVGAQADNYKNFLNTLWVNIRSASDEIVINFATDIVMRLKPDPKSRHAPDANLLPVIQEMESVVANEGATPFRPALPPFPPTLPTFPTAKLAARVAASNPVFSTNGKTSTAAIEAGTANTPPTAPTVKPRQ
jgi:hypothetical protein